MAIEAKAQTAMNGLSKKMGVAGIFLGWLFFICTAPDLQRVVLGSIVTVLFIIVTLWRQTVDMKANPKSVDLTKTLMGRMSAAMAMAGGFLTGLFASNISMELKMWGGFSVVVSFLIMQGIYDTVKANLNSPKQNERRTNSGRLLGGAPPPPIEE